MKWSDFMSRDAPKSDLIPVYEEMGKKLVVMYNYEKNLAESNKYSYPTVPESHTRPSNQARSLEVLPQRANLVRMQHPSRQSKISSASSRHQL